MVPSVLPMCTDLVDCGRTWLVRVFAGRDSETGKRQYQSNDSRFQEGCAVLLEGSAPRPGYGNRSWALPRQGAAKPRLRAKTLNDYTQLLARHVRPVLGGPSAGKRFGLWKSSLLTTDPGERPFCANLGTGTPCCTRRSRKRSSGGCCPSILRIASIYPDRNVSTYVVRFLPKLAEF